ncbi:BQ2448_3044 [Microbotryum intermedium]|uniref:BQ2448_3044 protein n=1 Tax=Microbotryum intermedium TaxID=269621 RepID=A0A238FK48_9BASI|nr:BQ2448_3044 [Microbotryum intermedium]
MAGLVIYGVTYLVVRTVDVIKTRRSPIVPIPHISDLATTRDRSCSGGGDSSSGSLLMTEVDTVPQNGARRETKQRPFTERQLKGLYRCWKHRADMLWSKQKGLEYAIARGWDVCWAGRATEFSTIRRARSEAQFIVDQLALAIAWCRSQQVPKTSFVSSLEPRAKKRRHSRSAHAICPPSLLELPWPLPLPPGEREYGAVIERVPRFTTESGEALPTYSPALDEDRGEQRLEFTPIAEGEERRRSTTS